MEATEVANKVVDLLGTAAEKVGQTAVTAFPFVVKYTFAKALVMSTMGLGFLAISAWGLNQWWKVVATKDENRYDFSGRDGKLVITLISFLLGLVLGVAFITNYAADVIEPIGATIMSIIHSMHN